MAKKMFDNNMTYKEIGKALKLTKERIRQLLNLGNLHGIITFLPRYKVHFAQLIKTLSKDQLIRTLKLGQTLKESCKKLSNDEFHVTIYDLRKLSKYYKINLRKYQQITEKVLREESKKKYMELYLNLFREIGRYPSTSYLREHPKFRKIYTGIGRYWKNINVFRKQVEEHSKNINNICVRENEY